MWSPNWRARAEKGGAERAWPFEKYGRDAGVGFEDAIIAE